MEHDANTSTTSSTGRGIARASAAIVADGLAVVAGFASTALVGALASEARRRDAAMEYRAGGIGRGTRRVERSEVRGDRICWFDERALSPPERSLWDALEALRLELNRAALLGLFSLEAHYAIYPPGAFYRRHRDRFRDDDARAISWALYLNEAWTGADGGALRIHLPHGGIRDVLPAGGTLACFLAERFEHEVLPPARERLSVTGWFRRRSPG